jgi:two-component system NtrC family sensor kinase
MGHFSISLSPMRDEQKAVNSVVVVMTDITDAALLQAKLAHSEKMATIGRLVSGVAHEVNNPLAAILGFTDLLLENPEVPGSAREDLQIILQETQRTKDIVQDLLSFARQRPVQRELVQVNSVLRQTIKLRSYDFASHGVEVVEDFEETLAAALGDSQQLQQVFLNILNNAYDAVQDAGQRGLIKIHTRRQAEMIEVAISDNGTGIVDAQRIFDPFYTTKQVGMAGKFSAGTMKRERGALLWCAFPWRRRPRWRLRLRKKRDDECAAGLVDRRADPAHRG